MADEDVAVQDSPAPDSLPAADPPSDAPPDDSPTDPPADSPRYVEEMAKRGVDVSKYQNEEAFWEGMAAQSRLVGRKSEAEHVLADLHGRLGEDGLAALLNGQEPSKPETEPSAAPPTEYPITQADLDQWTIADQSGKLTEADARKWGRHLREANAYQLKLLRGEVPDQLRGAIESIVQERVNGFKEEHSKMTAAERTKQREQERQAAFHQEYGSELFADPQLGWRGPLTPLGQQVADAYANDPECTEMPEGAARLRAAYRFVAPKPTPAKTVPKPRKTAQHEPPAKGNAKQITRTEFWKKFPDAGPGEMEVWATEHGFRDD